MSDPESKSSPELAKKNHAVVARLAQEREDTEKIPLLDEAATESAPQAPARRILEVPKSAKPTPGPRPENHVTFRDEDALPPSPAPSPGLSRRDKFRLGACCMVLLVTVPYMVDQLQGLKVDSRPSPILGGTSGAQSNMAMDRGKTANGNASIERAARMILGLSEQEPLPQSRIMEITAFDLSGQALQSAAGLTRFKNLQTLDLRDNQITSLHPLLSLPQLQKVDVRQNTLLCSSQRLNLQRLRDKSVQVISDCVE